MGNATPSLSEHSKTREHEHMMTTLHMCCIFSDWIAKHDGACHGDLLASKERVDEAMSWLRKQDIHMVRFSCVTEVGHALYRYQFNVLEEHNHDIHVVQLSCVMEDGHELYRFQFNVLEEESSDSEPSACSFILPRKKQKVEGTDPDPDA